MCIMKKTKRQLRAEAVERLRNYEEWSESFGEENSSFLAALLNKSAKEQTYKTNKAELIDLLTDDELPEERNPNWKCCETLRELNAKIDELTAENETMARQKANLKSRLDHLRNCWLERGTKIVRLEIAIHKLTFEREEWRSKCAKLLDIASEMQRVADCDD